MWRGSGAGYSCWRQMLDSFDIEDRWAFIRVAYIHNASYLGGLLGLIVALLLVRPRHESRT